MRLRTAVRVVVLSALGAGVALVLAVVLDKNGGGGKLTVVAAGKTVRLGAGTTLGQAASQLRLRPQAGDLLDVEGRLLRRGAVAGSLLLNGQRAPAGTRLRDGDRIDAADAPDRREPLTQQAVRVPGGMPADPQYLLARTPGSQVVVRGAISHKLVSAEFIPAGRPQVDRAVALTFDDGPSPRYTPRILATLARLHVPATFFLVGYLADSYPSLVRAELRAGMTVANHSYNHPEVPPFDELPQRLIADQIALGAESLRRAGADPKLFRPPGGAYSATVGRAAEALGERIVLWSVDPADWRPGTKAAQITKRVLAAARPGAIIILHDGGGDRTATLAALPAIVRGLRHRHLRLVAIPAR